jgi:superfamily II DNA/RNA helicase
MANRWFVQILQVNFDLPVHFRRPLMPFGIGLSWSADEGHKLKNEQSQQAQCVNRVRAERRLLLTGTPIQNNLRELWALFNLCVPGLLGDKQTFKQDFEKVITRGQSREATERERQQGVATSKQLRRKIEPYFRRREKEEVLSQPSEEESAYRSADLIGDELDEISRRSSSTSTANVSRQTNTDGRNIPPAPAPKRLGRKNDVVVWLKLSPQQRNVYHAFLTSPSVHAVLNRGGSALSALSVLKKICDHPQLMSEKAMRELSSEPKSHEGSFERSASSAESGELTKGCALQCIEKEARRVLSHPFADVRSCKTEFAIGITKRFIEDGHRLLMFSQSKEFLDVTERALQSHQIRYSRIDGDVPTDERQRRVDHFKSATLAEVPVFLLTSHVGGLGLNLYEASRVLILDPAWNPSTDNQAVDRIYRIGQEKDVIVMRLISCGTVEEKMYRKQVFKNGLSHASTSDSETMRYFTQEQLSDLFSAPDGALESSETKKQLDELHGGERECSDEVARELEHAESLSWAAGLTDHDMLFSRPDESSTGSGTKGPICIESSESAPAASGNKSSSKKGTSGDAKAPAAAWSGAGSNVSNILSARTQVKQKAKLSLAPTNRHHEASAPATKDEKRANEREYEAKESMYSRGKDDEADENKTLRNELDKVRLRGWPRGGCCTG